MKAPCSRDCPDRFAGDETRPNCHMTCEAYLAYNAERERIRAERFAEREINQTLEWSREQAFIRSSKRRR